MCTTFFYSAILIQYNSNNLHNKIEFIKKKNENEPIE